MKAPYTLVLLVLCVQSYSQNKKFEIKAGTGAGEYPFIIDKYSSAYTSDNLKYEDNGTYFCEVLHSITDKLSAGAGIVHQRNDVIHIPDFFDDLGTGGKYLAKQKKITSVVCSAYYYFLQKPNSAMYSGVSAGPAFIHIVNYELNTNTHTIQLAFQVTALGYRRGKNAGFFVEAGYGYKGIITAGGFIKL